MLDHAQAILNHKKLEISTLQIQQFTIHVTKYFSITILVYASMANWLPDLRLPPHLLRRPLLPPRGPRPLETDLFPLQLRRNSNLHLTLTTYSNQLTPPAWSAPTSLSTCTWRTGTLWWASPCLTSRRWRGTSLAVSTPPTTSSGSRRGCIRMTTSVRIPHLKRRRPYGTWWSTRWSGGW